MNQGFQMVASTSSNISSMTVLWDLESCPIPNDMKAVEAVSYVWKSIDQHRVNTGSQVRLTSFSAYGDCHSLSEKERVAITSMGVRLIHVPNGHQERTILADMFCFSMDHRAPATIFLISGQKYFSAALHRLGDRFYTVALAVPSGVTDSSPLFGAGKVVWDWSTLVRGGGLLSAKHTNFRGAQVSDESIESKPKFGKKSTKKNEGSKSRLGHEEEIKDSKSRLGHEKGIINARSGLGNPLGNVKALRASILDKLKTVLETVVLWTLGTLKTAGFSILSVLETGSSVCIDKMLAMDWEDFLLPMCAGICGAMCVFLSLCWLAWLAKTTTPGPEKLKM